MSGYPALAPGSLGTAAASGFGPRGLRGSVVTPAIFASIFASILARILASILASILARGDGFGAACFAGARPSDAWPPHPLKSESARDRPTERRPRLDPP